jgi:hypothetical protein
MLIDYSGFRERWARGKAAQTIFVNGPKQSAIVSDE